jgi:hypothetical protein
MNQDLSALLPDGRPFDFWEKETAWTREIHVDANNPSASDENDGSAACPFRPFGFRNELERLKMILDPKDVKPVAAAPDLPGRTEKTALPGPLKD